MVDAVVVAEVKVVEGMKVVEVGGMSGKGMKVGVASERAHVAHSLATVVEMVGYVLLPFAVAESGKEGVTEDLQHSLCVNN